MSFPRSRLSRFLFQARRWIAAPTAVLILAGCASTTEITTRHSNDEGSAPARSLLLVAQSPEPATRRVWEEVCQPLFQSNALSVHLAHQVRPVWYEDGGKQALLRWLRNQPYDRALIVDLTALLLSPPRMTESRDLNPMNSDMRQEPTWRIGIGGKLEKPKEPDAQQSYEAEFFDKSGRPLWTGVARTHEANNRKAIARSQCRALHQVLTDRGLIPK